MPSKFALFQDPYHPHAERFINLLQTKYGLRAICFYTDIRERIRHASEFPLLSSEVVAASYDVRFDRIADFAAYLKNTYPIAAVIPFSEPVVLNAVEIARRLDLSWAQPEIMRRFRDKFLLKDYLRKHHPQLRMSASLRVNSLADILEHQALPEYRRFVLKPNDGYGNRSIGLFDAATTKQQLTDHLHKQHGSALVMEEFIDGVEYFVNGQVDAAGKVIVVAGFEYERIAANGRHNIDSQTKKLVTTHPIFTVLSDYATRVMQATGLLRSPFHMEIKIDERGPCLIEVGARLAGHGSADLCGKMHGDLDLFDLAAHYYLTDNDYGALPLNWQRYDAMEVRYVHGIATHRERIHSLQGIKEVETMPEFVLWAKKPEVGQLIQPTVDSLSMPWSVVVQSPSESSSDARIEQVVAEVRAKLAWNKTGGLIAKLSAHLGSQLRRTSTGVRVRFLSVLGKSHEWHRPANISPSIASLMTKALRVLPTTLYSIGLRLQLRGWRSPLAGSLDKSFEDTARAAEIITWAESYLAKPHRLLGRKGAVCPFVQHTIDRGGFMVSFHDEIDGRSAAQMRRVILDEAERFKRRFPRDIRKGLFSSVVVVFSNLPTEKHHWVERMHDELKTYFTELELMCSPSHPACKKPSVTNQDFEVFTSPFAGFVVRHIDVRDIAFVGHNRQGFTNYRARFAEMFERGEVGNEFGYVDMYEQARRRFAQ